MMKKVMLVVLMVGISTLGMSQPRGGKGGKQDMEKRMEAAKQELELSDEQFEQWKEVHQKYGEEIKVAMEEKNRKKGKEIRDKMDKALTAILTEDQKVKFDKLKKNKPRRGPGKG